jgi:Terpene cyclase DEP1
MKPKTLYLLLCFAGLLLPYSQFVPWLMEERSLRGFLPAMFANRISGFFVYDVVVSAAVLVAFIAVERRRLPVRARWAPVVALLTVGVSLALPLFLYLREAELERSEMSGQAAVGR